MKIGVFIGKFLPLHMGHLNAIIKASTMCDKLYVVISQNSDFMKQRCDEWELPYMPLELVTMWMNKELELFRDHIEVVSVDETGVPSFPNGWARWSKLTRDALIQAGVKQNGWADFASNPVDIDYCFGSEEGYEENMKKYFNSDIEYRMIDIDRKQVPISATELVKNIYENWQFIPSSVRPHFVKKILVVGTESCGKSTVVCKLAKSFLTSWSEEYGKEYEQKFLGSYSGNWTVQDFERISMNQLEQDSEAYRTANKVAFVDTDAIVTSYYLDMYMGEKSDLIESLKKLEVGKWDLVYMLQPTVPFVQDGTRWEENRNKRWELHERLKSEYDRLGINYIEIGGDYEYRYTTILNGVRKLLKEV